MLKAINKSLQLPTEDISEIEEVSNGVVYYSYANGEYYSIDEDQDCGNTIDCYVCIKA